MKGVDGAGKRIKLHRLLDQGNQPIDPEAEIHRVAVQVDLQVSVEPEHQRAPNASIIALTSATSCPPHWSSTVTPFGSRAVSSAGVSGGRGDGRVEAGAWAGRHFSATGDSGTRVTPLTSTTGTNAGTAGSALSTAAASVANWCSRIHLRNWFVLMPSLSAIPATDTPGRRHASTSWRLSLGSKSRFPLERTRVTLSGGTANSASIMLASANSGCGRKPAHSQPQ